MSDPITVGEFAAREGWWTTLWFLVVFSVGSFHVVRLVVEWLTARIPRHFGTVSSTSGGIFGFYVFRGGFSILLGTRSLTFEAPAPDAPPAPAQEQMPPWVSP